MEAGPRAVSDTCCEIVVPQTIQEGRKFRQDMASTLKDRQFQLGGLLKESFTSIIQRYPTINSGGAMMQPNAAQYLQYQLRHVVAE